jgi:hypothetical protein
MLEVLHMTEPTLKASKYKARLTVTETVFHQPLDGDPTAGPHTPYTILLDTDEQPYLRHGRVGQEWTKMDVGWIKGCSMLCLSNEGIKMPPGQPTEGQRTDAASRLLEIGVTNDMIDMVVPFAQLPPGQSLRFPPYDLGTLMIRCGNIETRYILTLFPG